MTIEKAIYQLEDLIKDRESFMVGDYDKSIYDRDKEALQTAITALEKQIPKSEPKEKTGQWEIAIGYDIERTVMCDQCRKMAYEPSNFCPNCGAKMEV